MTISFPTQYENSNQAIVDVNHLPNSSNYQEIVHQASLNIQTIYDSAEYLRKNLSSREFSCIIKLAEDCLMKAKDLSRDNPPPEICEQINKMQQLFDELFRTLPPGDRVLFQRDIDNLQKLSEIPTNETYISNWGKYYEPQISIFGVANFFSDFCEKNGYSGTSIALKRDGLYLSCKNRMLTLIGFKKKKDLSFSLNDFFSPDLNTEEEEQKLEVLEALLNSKFKEWGFDAYEIVDVAEMQDARLLELQDDKKYGLFVLLYHKKVKNPGEIIELEDDQPKIQRPVKKIRNSKANAPQNRSIFRAGIIWLRNFFSKFLNWLLGKYS